MHRTLTRRQLVTGFVATLAAGAVMPYAGAAEKTTSSIVLRVKDMHCGDCAQKIARKLYAVPGVVKVRTDVKKHVAVIVPEAARQPSPKALWEAVEKAGFEPVQLVCAAGKFEKRPTR